MFARKSAAMIALFILVETGFSSRALAELSTITADDLYGQCQKKGTPSEGLCYGYAMAIADAMAGGRPLLGWRACLPAGVSADLIRDVMMASLNTHAAETHGVGAAGPVARAYARAFPCP
jgi:Ssp1 endopeptidase immunity protein Rap1a